MTRATQRTKHVLFAALFIISTIVLQFAHVQFASAATLTWDGSAGDLKFSTAANWSTNAVPQDGDVISFGVITGQTSDTNFTLDNDLSVSFGGIIFGDAAVNGSTRTTYTISDIQLASTASITKVNASGVNYTNVFVYTDTLTGGSNLTLSNNPTINRSSVDADFAVQNLTISGGGGLSALSQSGGGVGYTPAQYNFKPVAVTVTTGSSYTVSNAATTVTTQNGARVFVTAAAQAATYNLGTSTEALAGLAAQANVNLTGTVNLTGDAYYYIYGANTLTVSGTLNGSGSFKKGTGSTGTFVNSASTNNSDTPEGTQEVEVEELPAVTDDQSGTSLTILPKTSVALDGARGYVSVAAGGILKGTGTATSLYVFADGTVAPGHSPGTLTVLESLNLLGTYEAEVLNKDTYDQLKVGANYASNGNAVMLQSGAKLNLVLFDGWSIEQGNQFTIIDNLHSSAVSGTFEGLAEGAQFTVDGITFSITYIGGDGNDVVVTALNEGTDPNAPNTGVAKLLLANPLLIVSLGFVTAGLLFFIATRRAN